MKGTISEKMAIAMKESTNKSKVDLEKALLLLPFRIARYENNTWNGEEKQQKYVFKLSRQIERNKNKKEILIAYAKLRHQNRKKIQRDAIKELIDKGELEADALN